MVLFVCIALIIMMNDISTCSEREEEVIDLFRKLLKENIILPQHKTNIISRLKEMRDNNRNSLAFYATGRAGCGKTKTLSCIEKAFTKINYKECNSNLKCHLQINGYSYINDTIPKIHQDLEKKINNFINVQHDKCDQLFVLVEYSQLIHFPLLAIVNNFVNMERVEGISDFITLGKIIFLISGNRGYSNAVHPTEQVVIIDNDKIVGGNNVVSKNYDEIDDFLKGNILNINKLDKEYTPDLKLLNEEGHEEYIKKANQFFKSNKVAFLIFNQQDLKQVINLKIKELTVSLLNYYELQVVWNIEELTESVYETLNREKNRKALYSDGGRAVTEYLKEWKTKLELHYIEYYTIISTRMLKSWNFDLRMRTLHLKNIFEKENIICSNKQDEILLMKQLSFFEMTPESFVKKVKTTLGTNGEKFYCKRTNEETIEITTIDYNTVLGKIQDLYSAVYKFENIDKFIENEKKISMLKTRTCPPWDSDNFVGL